MAQLIKNPPAMQEDLGSNPGLGRSPREENRYPLKYPGLENSMDYSPWGHKELDTTEPLSLSNLAQGIPEHGGKRKMSA